MVELERFPQTNTAKNYLALYLAITKRLSASQALKAVGLRSGLVEDGEEQI